MKTKTSHTPGPWCLHPRLRVNMPEPIVYSDNGGCIVATVNTSAPEIGEREANARLIAAAPDLLTVAREIVQYLRAYHELNQRCAELAEDAIAKAEGK